MKQLRTPMFVPGNDPRKLEKAKTLRPDAVILDLEDSVAEAEKESARTLVHRFLDDGADLEPSLFIRFSRSSPSEVRKDMRAYRSSERLDGVVLPKVEKPETVVEIREVLAGMGLYELQYFVIVETPKGVMDCYSIAKCDGVIAVAFGVEDFITSLGARKTPEGPVTTFARAKVLLETKAADRMAVDSAYTTYQDLAGLEAECLASKGQGFDGKLVIHPAQLEVINRCFLPSPDEIAWAREVLSVLNSHKSKGVTGLSGEMIDKPVELRAQRILDSAREAGLIKGQP